MERIVLLAALAAAYVTKTGCADTLGGKDNAEAYVAPQLDNVERYFRDHAKSEEFYSTSDLQVFHEEAHARNHAHALGAKTILRIERADLGDLLVPVETADKAEETKTDSSVVIGAKAAAPVTPYDALTIAKLKEACEARKMITVGMKAKSDYIKALTDDDAAKAAAPAAEPAQDNTATVVNSAPAETTTETPAP